MSQQFPPPGQQPPPGYGYPPPPPKKTPVGKIVGFSCLGVVGVVVLIGILGALLSDSSDDSTGKRPAASSAPSKAPEAPTAEQSSAAPEKKAPSIVVTAKKTALKPTILGDGDYTSVSVTVTNNSKKSISVNPLYFAITDTAGTKHAAELMADENQIDTVELAPGENVTGAVTGKGKWTAKTVTYTDGLIGDAIRADVS